MLFLIIKLLVNFPNRLRESPAAIRKGSDKSDVFFHQRSCIILQTGAFKSSSYFEVLSALVLSLLSFLKEAEKRNSAAFSKGLESCVVVACSDEHSELFLYNGVQAAAHIAAWNGLAFQTQKAKLTKAVATSLTSVKAAVGGPLKGMQTSLKAMVTKLRTGKEVRLQEGSMNTDGSCSKVKKRIHWKSLTGRSFRRWSGKHIMQVSS